MAVGTSSEQSGCREMRFSLSLKRDDRGLGQGGVSRDKTK